jgi:hypothetical protein
MGLHRLLPQAEPRRQSFPESEDVAMTHVMHEAVVDEVQKAIYIMDRLLKRQIDLDEYKSRILGLDVEGIMAAHREDFKSDPSLIYYLDALMLLSSLQIELDFQVAEYGVNVALEDKKNLEELSKRFPEISDS